VKILVACEESQAVTIELRKLGHEAYSCDIEPCSGNHPEWHIMQDVIPILDGDCEFQTCDGETHRIDGIWDELIAFPPCTYISNAGACRLYPHKGKIDQSRYEKGMAAKEFFMLFINANCSRIAIENPVPSTIFQLPKHTQEIQPWQFGHPYTKKTRLWLKGLPNLNPTKVVAPVSPYCPSGTGRKIRDKYGAAKRGEDAKNRAKTFHGIARAMADQWAGKNVPTGSESEGEDEQR